MLSLVDIGDTRNRVRRSRPSRSSLAMTAELDEYRSETKSSSSSVLPFAVAVVAEQAVFKVEDALGAVRDISSGYPSWYMVLVQYLIINNYRMVEYKMVRCKLFFLLKRNCVVCTYFVDNILVAGKFALCIGSHA
jgi:hypothetical protein